MNGSPEMASVVWFPGITQLSPEMAIQVSFYRDGHRCHGAKEIGRRAYS